jgi:hypothetical protein
MELLLSLNQENRLALEGLEHPVSHLWSFIEVLGQLDREALKRAVHHVVDRHTALRTIFPGSCGNRSAIMTIGETVDFVSENLDPAELGEERVYARARHWVRQPLDIQNGPLVRLAVFGIAEDRYFVLLIVHHIAADGWSMGIFWDEVGLAYRSHVQGTPLSLPPVVPYEAFARWQRQYLSDRVREQHEQYWCAQLNNAASLPVPADFRRGDVRSFEGETYSLKVEFSESHALSAFCRRERCTLFVLLLGALNVAVRQWTGASDICVLSPIANRPHPIFEKVIGYFANSLIIRYCSALRMTTRELLRDIGNVFFDGLDHAALPLTHVLRRVNYVGEPGVPPLAQIVLSLQNYPSNPVTVDKLTVIKHRLDVGISAADVAILAFAQHGGLDLLIEYDTTLFKRQTIELFAVGYVEILRAMMRDPSAPIETLLTANADVRLGKPLSPVARVIC